MCIFFESIAVYASEGKDKQLFFCSVTPRTFSILNILDDIERFEDCEEKLGITRNYLQKFRQAVTQGTLEAYKNLMASNELIDYDNLSYLYSIFRSAAQNKIITKKDFTDAAGDLDESFQKLQDLNESKEKITLHEELGVLTDLELEMNDSDALELDDEAWRDKKIRNFKNILIQVPEPEFCHQSTRIMELSNITGSEQTPLTDDDFIVMAERSKNKSLLNRLNV